jgi:hypothetical protein
VDELALAAALNQAGIGQDFEVVRNGGRSNAAQGYDFPAVHFRSRGDGLKNLEASLVAQSFRNFFDARAFHVYDQCSEVSSAGIVAAKRPHFSSKNMQPDI